MHIYLCIIKNDNRLIMTGNILQNFQFSFGHIGSLACTRDAGETETQTRKKRLSFPQAALSDYMDSRARGRRSSETSNVSKFERVVHTVYIPTDGRRPLAPSRTIRSEVRGSFALAISVAPAPIVAKRTMR